MSDEPHTFSVSHTKMAAFRRCLQKYHWLYIDKYFPPSAMGQVRGTAGHAALAIWHTTYDAAAATAKAWEEWSNNGYGQGDDWQLLEDSLLRYYEWSITNDTFVLVEAEHKFELQYDSFRLTGYIDGIVKEADKLWLLENKFYKRMDKSTKETDAQVSVYLLAAHVLGFDVNGVIYNQVRVADTKVAVTEPVVRQRLYRRSDGLAHIELEIKRQVTAMQTYHQKGGEPYRNFTPDCSWDCPFYNACLSMLDDGQEPTEILKTLADTRRNQDGE